MRGCIPPNYRMKGIRPMKKENFSYNVNEENADQFAVVPHDQLVAIYQMVNTLDTQITVLKTILENAGIDGYSYTKRTKTLADVKINT